MSYTPQQFLDEAEKRINKRYLTQHIQLAEALQAGKLNSSSYKECLQELYDENIQLLKRSLEKVNKSEGEEIFIWKD